MQKRWMRSITVLASLAMLATFVLGSASAASAETTNVPADITVSPVTNLVDGSTIHIHAAGLDGYTVLGVTARLCKASTTISIADDFTPTKGGNCIKDPLSAGSDNKTAMSTAPPLNVADLDFIVGVGQQTFMTQYGDTVTIGCGPTESDCKLTLELSISGDGSMGPVNGKVYKSYLLDYQGLAVAPDAPVNVTATAGNAKATVNWSVPPADGGSAITGYTVTALTANGAALPTPKTCTTTGALTCDITGLTNNTAYKFSVTATNAIGTSPASIASAAVTPVPPATVPGAPTNVTGVGGNTKVTVSWTAPQSNGGAAITGYTVTAFVSSTGLAVSPAKTCVTATTSCTISGLTNGTAYKFKVKASNSVGASDFSAISAAVTPNTTAPTAAPTAVTGVAGAGQVTVSWTGIATADNGGASVTSYTVTALTANGGAISPAKTCTTTSGSVKTCIVTGLTNGTAYTFIVKANNARGASPASAASAQVTPRTTPGAPSAVTVVANAVGSKSIKVSWNAPLNNGGSAITSYIVTAYNSAGVAISPARTCTSTAVARSCSVGGLTAGTSYKFKVVAVNVAGNGVASTISAAVTAR